MKPLAFKVRTQGTYNGAKGGKVKSGFGGAGALWYEDKTFTIAATQDQWLLAPTLSLSLSHPKPPMTQQPIPQVLLRFLSVCSGMEAASVAWEPLGWKAVGFSEIEPFPCAVLAHRFPTTPNYGSLLNYAQWPVAAGSIDLLVGGTPCQSFSVAGLRKGMADPRGNLALVFLGLADRVKPRWIVWENVPGVLSSNGGRDFGAFLGALEQLGYGWAYRVLDAQHFGVPQRRRRVFVVACLGAGGWESAAKVLFEPESLCGDTAKGRKKGQGVAADAEGGAGSGSGPIVIDRAAFNQGENAQFNPHIGPADVMDPLVARGPHAVGVQPVSHWDGGPHPTLNQSAKGSGGVGSSNQELFSQGGAYLVPGDAVPFRKSKRASSATDSESWVEAGAEPSTTTTTTLKASAGDQMPHVAIQGTIIGRGEHSGPQGTGATDGGPMFTLTKTDIHGIATPMAVRRLTPTECERLQGFPDGWSCIPWKGKPADQCPDGPRYKACGNSMAVPVMRWIGSRISLVEQLSNPQA